MKKTILIILFSMVGMVGFSQISLDYCLEKSRENYPNYANSKLYEEIANLSNKSMNTGYLPQLSMTGNISTQTDVTRIDIDFPMPMSLDLPTMPREQYALTLEFWQVIWDGGYIDAMKKENMAKMETNKAELEVELYTIRENIANIYFGILGIKERKLQSQVIRNEINRNIEQIKAFIDNGLATQSDLDLINVEGITLSQRIEELDIAEKAYLNILSYFMGETIGQDAVFEESSLSINEEGSIENRPEIMAMESQINLLNTKKNTLKYASIPKLIGFAQGGYGKPHLNMFSENPDFFAKVGLKLDWDIASLYSFKNNKKIIDANKSLVMANRAGFELGLKTKREEYLADIAKHKSLLDADIKIIELRERIKNTSDYRLENGEISTSDYIKDVNAYDLANQKMVLHKVELMMAVFRYNNLINK